MVYNTKVEEFTNMLHDRIKIIKDSTDKNNRLKLIRWSNHMLNTLLVLGKSKLNCIQKAIRMIRGYENSVSEERWKYL